MRSQSTPTDKPGNGPKHLMGPTAAALATLGVCLGMGCDTPGVTLVDPSVTGRTDTAVIHVQLEDSALAQTLGWRAGVPRALVLLQRIGEDYRPDSLWADSTGKVFIDDLLPGFYRVAAHRMLSQTEAGALGGGSVAFGTGSKLRLAASSKTVLSLGAGKRGSLMLSEIYVVQQYLANEYMWFQYYELYNNGDTTVYLDGMILGRAWHLYKDYTPYPCVVTEPMRIDSAGIWAQFFHSFPGTGRDYPVAPGGTVTIAMDAVDHSVVHASFPDLSSADFELEGTADVDNPDVPNMPDVGLRPSLRGHGLDGTSHDTYFLSAAVELNSLFTLHDASTGADWVRFPASGVLDVVSLHDGRGYDDAQTTPCLMRVHPRFDRLEGGFLNNLIDSTRSFHRRMLPGYDPTGNPRLHDVNTSFIDILVAPLSPGRVAN